MTQELKQAFQLKRDELIEQREALVDEINWSKKELEQGGSQR